MKSLRFVAVLTVLGMGAWGALSAGAQSAVREGQVGPMTPEESLRQIQLDGPYEAQLLAAEPLVLDPVECTWDAQGRMFVADMLDYPLGPKREGEPWLSRIVQLIDEDGDGRMDRSVVFAEHLDHVQGLLPYNGGLIATTRTQVLFLKDVDGDGRAEVVRPLIAGFNPRFSQLQVSAPRWGPDGCVHFNNGLDAREIYPAEDPSRPVNVPGSNFKWDPRTGQITATGGKGQYGGAFDDWGHHFYCSNRNPVMFTVMPFEVLSWNRAVGLTMNYEDIAPSGPETRVFPLKITHTTADAHAGTNTACSGLGVYRGDWMPELRNNVFVPDPTGQLITRYQVEPRGSSLVARRVGERREFFRSGDEWCRPVNVTTAPDGSLVVCDMYRRWIDHARFFPEEFVKANDLRQGEHQGRIWRIIPKGGKVAPAAVPGRYHAIPETGWGSIPVESPQRAALLGLSRETSTEELARWVSTFPEDVWLARKVAACAGGRSGRVLAGLADSFFAEASENRSATVKLLASGASQDGGEEEVESLVGVLMGREPERLLWWKPALLQGMAKVRGARKDLAERLERLEAQAEEILESGAAPVAQRLAVLPLLEQRRWEVAEPLLRRLLLSGPPPELGSAAMAMLRRLPVLQTQALVYAVLPKAGPSLKRDLVALLSANPASALELFRRMERGEFPAAWVDVETRWRYQNSKGEIAEVAKRLFGEASGDRASVVNRYLSAAKREGVAAKGRALFETLCVGCHRYGSIGAEVGPALSDVKLRPPEALISDILDPNRMVEARWSAYQVELSDGRTMVGLIASETADALVVALPGGARETIARGTIRELKSLDRSLMPPGLEAAISIEQMADLIAFLTGR